MATLRSDDGVNLYYEDTGSGTPIVFVHEYAGDVRSWEPQVRHFSRRYRCITFNARGYPPSDVPGEVDSYSQARARDDILAVLDGLGIARAHIVGCRWARSRPCISACTTQRARCRWWWPAAAMARIPTAMPSSRPTRATTRASSANRASPRSPPATARARAAPSCAPRIRAASRISCAIFPITRRLGSANTMEGYQARRPSLYALEAELAAITSPCLIIAGDEDDPTLEPGLFMKRRIKSAGLAVLPRSGHVLNLEDPALFNQLVEEFFHQVESGRWRAREA
jgi:pimeloyl-ACP methyl ester carboxylesterase